MKREEFKSYLESENLAKAAIAHRLTMINKVEDILGVDPDVIVSSDTLMAESLMKLKAQDSKEHAPLQNSLRKYYKFQNGRDFPKMRDIV